MSAALPGRFPFHSPVDPVGLAASLALHAAIAIAVFVQLPEPNAEQSDDDAVRSMLTYLVPPNASPAVSEAGLQYAPDGGDGGDATGELGASGSRRAGEDGGQDDDSERGATGAERDPDAISAGASEEMADVYRVLEVDSAAVPDPTSAAPAYPPELLSARVEGWAAVRFVVDTTGRVDLATVRSLGFTSPEFLRAVRDALPGMRFRPAMMGDRPVRQVAEQTFVLKVVPADP